LISGTPWSECVAFPSQTKGNPALSKFNRASVRAATGASPIVSEPTPSGTTFAGAPGYAGDAKSELFLLAVTNMVGEQTFYETAGARDGRYQTLVREVCVADPVWTAGFLAWLRGEANMRSAALVGAAEFVYARLTDEGTDSLTYSLASNRRVIDSVLQRADEPGELLAYWTSRYGRAIPKPGGTNTAQAVRAHYASHDRVVIVTDEQAHYDHRGGVDSAVPAKVPMYTWNLAYGAGW
jgi:hypothetical protein